MGGTRSGQEEEVCQEVLWSVKGRLVHSICRWTPVLGGGRAREKGGEGKKRNISFIGCVNRTFFLSLFAFIFIIFFRTYIRRPSVDI